MEEKGNLKIEHQQLIWRKVIVIQLTRESFS